MTASSPVFSAPRLTSLRWLLVLALVGLLAGCGVNTIPRDNQAVKAAWAQVQNEYQRRADLIPNLVSTVKGYAKQERETLTAVTQARAKATSIQVDASTIDNPDKLKRYLSVQDHLSGALGRLLAVSERYPDLKSNQNFLALQSQLEGTENRIAVARRDYIQAVQKYNTDLVTFPGRIWHWLLYSDMKPHANFKASAPNAEQAPKVSF
ncbi:LemA family protein [Salinisphaera hydrothermalis]|uniref:LemA family protein n=1 Tax=Salinisphaera hydrothermalis TaxID=563188 RepID=UPI003342B845